MSRMTRFFLRLDNGSKSFVVRKHPSLAFVSTILSRSKHRKAETIEERSIDLTDGKEFSQTSSTNKELFLFCSDAQLDVSWYTDNGSKSFVVRKHPSLAFVSTILSRSKHRKAETIEERSIDLTDGKEFSQTSSTNKESLLISNHKLVNMNKSDDEFNGRKWMLEFPWLSKALEPAVEMIKWVSATEYKMFQDSGLFTEESECFVYVAENETHNVPPSSRSLVEIISYLQRSKLAIQDWSLGDLTVGLYLVSVRQASEKQDDIKGVQIFSDSLVQDLIYHVELAKGAYKGNAAGLARHSMLQEKNILKFVSDSSVMRPGYYIGIDVRNKIVVLGIRGTDTIYDIITDIVSSSDKKETLFEGFSAHFGTAEAARWFLYHELKSIRKCLEKHKGFRLRIVGHSLGGACAALLAMILRRKSVKELGFDPDVVSAVGFGTPPCLSKNLAESCSDYVSNVIMQDDIVPRLSVASLTWLRNEVVSADWRSTFEKEDYKRVVELIDNAKQAVSIAQDVAKKLSQFAKLMSLSDTSDNIPREKEATSSRDSPRTTSSTSTVSKLDSAKTEELHIPGTLYYLKKHEDAGDGKSKGRKTYSMWKMRTGYPVQRILLGNPISDHKCDSHYYALRDVLKGLPVSDIGAYVQ